MVFGVQAKLPATTIYQGHMLILPLEDGRRLRVEAYDPIRLGMEHRCILQQCSCRRVELRRTATGYRRTEYHKCHCTSLKSVHRCFSDLEIASRTKSTKPALASMAGNLVPGFWYPTKTPYSSYL